MDTKWQRKGAAVAALLAALGLNACSDASGAEESQSVSLSVVAAASAGASLSDPITGGGHTLDLTAVDVTLAEVTLEREEGLAGGGDSDGAHDGDSDSESDSDSEGSANERFRAGAITLALPLEGGVVTPVTVPIPVGVYEELEADIAFVRLRGTFDGQAFDVTVPVDEEFEFPLEPAFEVDDAADVLNITLSFAVLDWFRNPDGTLVDPRLLATTPALRALLVNRIEASFDAFEDSDRDADDADSDSDRDSDRN